jgi:hypothetical protein
VSLRNQQDELVDLHGANWWAVVELVVETSTPAEVVKYYQPVSKLC